MYINDILANLSVLYEFTKQTNLSRASVGFNMLLLAGGVRFD